MYKSQASTMGSVKVMVIGRNRDIWTTWYGVILACSISDSLVMLSLPVSLRRRCAR